MKDEFLDVVSPFGRYSLSVGSIDPKQPIGLLSVQGRDEFSTWRVNALSEWCDEDGCSVAPGVHKAKALGGEGFEPLYWEQSFRGMGSKPDLWTVVLLPSPVESVREKGNGVCIEAGGKVFVLPPGRSSKEVLAGKVQWGLPDDTGFFVLQPR